MREWYCKVNETPGKQEGGIMRELTPREKLANLFANFKSGGADGTAGHWAGMAIDMLCKEVEKVENHYDSARRWRRDRTGPHIDAQIEAYESCRQDFLALLRGDNDRP